MNSLINSQLKFVSDAGDRNFFVEIFGAAACLYLYYFGYLRALEFILFSAISFPIGFTLKYLFKEKRPKLAKPELKFDIYSFPSSHTFFYTTFWGFLIFLTTQLGSLSLLLKLIVNFVSIYFIALVGISRVYLKEHFVWDVIAGYAFGLLYLCFLIYLWGKN